MEHFLTREISLSPVPDALRRYRTKLALEDAVIHQVIFIDRGASPMLFPSCPSKLRKERRRILGMKYWTRI